MENGLYVYRSSSFPTFDDLAKRALKWEGVVYDLQTPDLIKAYAFEDPLSSYTDPTDSSKVHFQAFPQDDITHWNGCLYIYHSPLPGREKHSNGTVPAYKPVFRSQ